jgi:nuclear pore complex protein Nup98-Nup96
MRPTWGPDGTLVYSVSPKPVGKSSRRARDRDGLLTFQKGSVVSESRDVRFAKFSYEVSLSFAQSSSNANLEQAAAHALKKQIAMTTIEESEDVPFAILNHSFSFSDFFDDQANRNPAVAHEKLVWQLAGVLFDEIKVPEKLEQFPDAYNRLRKDKLSAFWQKLVDQKTTQGISMARSHEEKAIIALAGHRIADACGHLVNGKNFHLATLVAQIGGKESSRKDMREQLNEWKKSNVLSEFSQPIRAIYEILAGNVCICEGFKGAIEDKIDSFVISNRFGLDWRQAFGLRLWYGTLASEDLSVAVEKFGWDLSQNLETSAPVPWFFEQKIPTLWEDKSAKQRDDLLWGLLRLYAFAETDLEEVVRPENSQLSPLDSRLSWQLSRALHPREKGGYTNEKSDQVTVSFASQLTNEGSWLEAVFVLLHLSDDDARATSIQDHLARHAGRIGAEDSENFTALIKTFRIPARWIWEAKALYMRSVKNDSRAEVEFLIRAGSFEEAHRTFARDVGPKSVIERDYDSLRILLNGFRGKEHAISEWRLGGEIYLDYLELLDYEKKAKALDYSVVERLLSGLPNVVEESRHPSFLETVAIETISGIVAKTVVALGKKGDVSLVGPISNWLILTRSRRAICLEY